MLRKIGLQLKAQLWKIISSFITCAFMQMFKKSISKPNHLCFKDSNKPSDCI